LHSATTQKPSLLVDQAIVPLSSSLYTFTLNDTDFFNEVPTRITVLPEKFYVLEYGETEIRVIQNDCQGFNNLPPCSPVATPCDFFLCGYVKDQVYVPPLPSSIPELQIRTTIETITADMLQTVWNELNYRVDVCRITKGAHIEHL